MCYCISAILTFYELLDFIAGSNRTVMFVCCRDGGKRGHTGQTKTGKTRKSKHSRKLDNFCTARMIATEYLVDGRVEVKYYSNHTNHQLELSECSHLPLPKSVVDEIGQQCAAGIPIERIMESMYIDSNNYSMNHLLYLHAIGYD